MTNADTHDLVITIRLNASNAEAMDLLDKLRSKVHHPQYAPLLRGWTEAQELRWDRRQAGR